MRVAARAEASVGNRSCGTTGRRRPGSNDMNEETHHVESITTCQHVVSGVEWHLRPHALLL